MSNRTAQVELEPDETKTKGVLALLPPETGATEEAAPGRRGPWLIDRVLAPLLIFAARLVAVAMALGVWSTVVLAIWCVRVISVCVGVSIWNVACAWRGEVPAHSVRLEAAVLFWPRGFIAICRMLFETAQPHGHPEPAFGQMVLEAAITVVVLTTLFFTNEIAKGSGGHLRASVAALEHWLVLVLQGGWMAIAERLEEIRAAFSGLL